jgi:hypothetical protein
MIMSGIRPVSGRIPLTITKMRCRAYPSPPTDLQDPPDAESPGPVGPGL